MTVFELIKIGCKGRRLFVRAAHGECLKSDDWDCGLKSQWTILSKQRWTCVRMSEWFDCSIKCPRTQGLMFSWLLAADPNSLSSNYWLNVWSFKFELAHTLCIHLHKDWLQNTDLSWYSFRQKLMTRRSAEWCDYRCGHSSKP